MHGSGSLKWFMASALAVMAPGPAGAACVDDTSGLDQVLARYGGNKFTRSPHPATAGAGDTSGHTMAAGKRDRAPPLMRTTRLRAD